MRHSLRTRVFAVCFAIGTGVSVLFGVLSLVLIEGLEFEQIDLVLRAESSLFIEQHRERPETPPPTSNFLSGWVVNDNRIDDLPKAYRDLAAGSHEVETEHGETRVLVSEIDGRRYVFTMDLSVTDVWEDRVFGAVIVLVVACSLVGALVGRALARRVAEPVTRLADQVSANTTSAGETRFAASQRDDEVGALARAMDGYVTQLRDYARREHDFTAHVSHELRTPLAVASSAIELLLDDASIGEDARRRLRGAERSLAGMHQTVESLLALARTEAGTSEEQDVDVAAVLDEVVEACQPLLAGRAVTLRRQVDARPLLRTLPGALHVVLRNLLANACAHTIEGEITVRLANREIVVRDSGPGIAEQDLPHVERAGFRGRGARGDGEGLGLAIVQRLCAHYRWRLELETTVGVGTTVTLHFG